MTPPLEVQNSGHSEQDLKKSFTLMKSMSRQMDRMSSQTLTRGSGILSDPACSSGVMEGGRSSSIFPSLSNLAPPVPLPNRPSQLPKRMDSNFLANGIPDDKIDHLINAAGAPFGIEGPIQPYAGIFDMFKIGVGPSSSHTNGPMNIGADFVSRPYVSAYLEAHKDEETSPDNPYRDFHDFGPRVVISLYGSLAATGVGHGTDDAVLVGLNGLKCDEVDDSEIPEVRRIVDTKKALNLGGQVWLRFDYDQDFEWHDDEEWAMHPNGMSLALYDKEGEEVDREDYLSLGGGFFVTTSEYEEGKDGTRTPVRHPYCFKSWEQLRAFCIEYDITVAELMYQNEIAEGQTRAQVYAKIDRLIRVMFDCINKGCSTEGPLPLRGMRRNAQEQYLRLKSGSKCGCKNDPLQCMDFVSIYARAVNEENACGRTVVTAPTNGACGIIPAVMAYYWNFLQGSTKQGLRDFIAVAAAIGSLIKRNASISGAEAGCQAEVGSAISMAAAALCFVLGGDVDEVGFAAEMGIEHSLGLTCDPVGGLVVVPCIDRNALGSTKAIMCARLAFLGRDAQVVSLDSVIETMFMTGVDLQAKYRETAQGGLAVLGLSPTRKSLIPVYIKPSSTEISTCSGCACEIETSCGKDEKASEFGIDLTTKVDQMHDQTRELQQKMVNEVIAAETKNDVILPGARATCQKCLERDAAVIKIRRAMEAERGIPLAIECNIGKLSP